MSKNQFEISHQLGQNLEYIGYNFDNSRIDVVFGPSVDTIERKNYVAFYSNPRSRFLLVFTINVDEPDILILSRIRVPKEDQGKGHGRAGLLTAVAFYLSLIQFGFKELRLYVDLVNG